MIALLFFAGLAVVGGLVITLLYDLGMDHNAAPPAASSALLSPVKSTGPDPHPKG